MNFEPVNILGGESIYCLNKKQLELAYELLRTNNELQRYQETIDLNLDRNEKAALAFILIDSLINSSGVDEH